MTSVSCLCNDWEPQRRILDHAMQMDQLRSATSADYTKFKRFNYCPWCGEVLLDEEVVKAKKKVKSPNWDWVD